VAGKSSRDAKEPEEARNILPFIGSAFAAPHPSPGACASRSIPPPRNASSAFSGARKSAGLTQAEVAGRLRKPQSFVAKYENGERRLDVLEFVALCRAIEADAVEIVRELASEHMRGRRSRKSGREA
jgi:hypothetical protein